MGQKQGSFGKFCKRPLDLRVWKNWYISWKKSWDVIIDFEELKRIRTLLSKFSLLRFRLFFIVNTQFGSSIMLNLRLIPACLLCN